MVQDQRGALAERGGRADEDAIDVIGASATGKRRVRRRRWRRALRRMLKQKLALAERCGAVLARNGFLPGGRGIEPARAPHAVAGAVAEAHGHLKVRDDFERLVAEGRRIADAVI